MSEIASAYLTIYPKLEGKAVASEITRGLSGEGTRAGKLFSSNMGDEVGKGGSKIASGLSAAKIAIGNIVADMAMSAASEFASRFGEGIAQSDAMQKFASTMEFAGVATDQIETVRKAMKDYADQTVYDLGEVLDTTAKLASNGVANYDALVQAAGNLNAAAGGNSESFGYFANAITQVNGAGKLMAQDWNQIVNALPGASGAIQKELEAMGAWDSSLGNFKDAMSEGEISAEEFNQAIQNLGMTDVAQQAATSATTYEGAVGQMDAAITNFMQSVYDAINGEGRVTGFINSVASAFDTLAPTVGQVVGTIADGIGSFATTILPSLQAAFATVLPAFQQFGATVLPLVAGAFQQLGDIISTVLPIVIPIFADMLANGLSMATGLINALSPLAPLVTSVFGIIKGVIVTAMTVVRAIVAAVSAAMQGNWSAALNAMKMAVSTAINAIKGVFGTLKSKVLGALSGAGTWLSGVGRSIVQGLASGIRNAVGWVTDAVRSVCSNALSSLKSFFGIKSPSRLMAQMGRYMMSGLALGIDSGADAAVRAMEGASADVAGALTGPSYGTFGAADGYGGTTYNVYLNDVSANDDAGIVRVTRDYLIELQRLGAI